MARRRSRRALPAAALLALACGGDGSDRAPVRGAGGLEVRDPVITEPIAGGAGALYLRLENRGDRPARLTGISVAGADASLHRTRERGGRSAMAPVDAVPVAAGAAARLRPGGYHGMIRWTGEPPGGGDTVRVTLGFEGDPGLDVAAPVVSNSEALERHPPPGSGKRR